MKQWVTFSMFLLPIWSLKNTSEHHQLCTVKKILSTYLYAAMILSSPSIFNSSWAQTSKIKREFTIYQVRYRKWQITILQQSIIILFSCCKFSWGGRSLHEHCLLSPSWQTPHLFSQWKIEWSKLSSNAILRLSGVL